VAEHALLSGTKCPATLLGQRRSNDGFVPAITLKAIELISDKKHGHANLALANDKLINSQEHLEGREVVSHAPDVIGLQDLIEQVTRLLNAAARQSCDHPCQVQFDLKIPLHGHDGFVSCFGGLLI